ncbi:MAG TPA: glycosyltransferase [Acidimicrobiales bacterium]|nr:glycosyltransferase [Acidimicrobiales bacterium]
MVEGAGSNPRVTVIIPTYNWSTVLPYSIASVLEQTYADFELLVIGDGCTDDSADVVARCEDPRVRWHNLRENTGNQAGPNNEGIRQAQGDVIAYLGHDDLWLRDHLSHLVHAIDNDADLVHANALFVLPSRKPYRWPTPGWRYRPGIWVPPTTVVHRRALADAVGGWRMPRDTGDLDAESDLWQRIVAKCGPPIRVKRVTSVKLHAGFRPGVYRQRPHHEQAYWLERIRASAGPGGPAFPGDQRSAISVRATVRSIRATAGLRTRLRSHRLLPTAPTVSAEERRLRDRRLKGIDEPSPHDSSSP